MQILCGHKEVTLQKFQENFLPSAGSILSHKLIAP